MKSLYMFVRESTNERKGKRMNGKKSRLGDLISWLLAGLEQQEVEKTFDIQFCSTMLIEGYLMQKYTGNFH